MASRSNLIGSKYKKKIIGKTLVSNRMYQPSILTEEQLSHKKFIFEGMRQSNAIEAYRSIRTQLLEITSKLPQLMDQGDEKRSPVIMVTSVVANGGATQTAINLAASYALDRNKTALLVDCNFKSPSIHTRLDINYEFGLSDFLNKDVLGVDNIVYPTGIPRLRVIPSGRFSHAASELFTTMRMEALFKVLRKRYSNRYIFVDAPPIQSCADTQILENFCDGVVVVLPSGTVADVQLKRILSGLKREKFLGVIFNNKYS